MCEQRRLPVRQIVAALTDEQAQAIEADSLFHGREEFMRCPEGVLGTLRVEEGERTTTLYFREYARGTTRGGFYVSIRRRATTETGTAVGRKHLYASIGREGSAAFAAMVAHALHEHGIEKVRIEISPNVDMTWGQKADLGKYPMDAFPLPALIALVGQPIPDNETRPHRSRSEAERERALTPANPGEVRGDKSNGYYPRMVPANNVARV